MSYIRGDLLGFQSLARCSVYAIASIWVKLDAPSKGLGLCGRSVGWWHKPTAVVPGSKPRMAAVLAPSLCFRVDSLWRCKDKARLPGAATSMFLLSGGDVTGSLMFGLCSQRLSVSEGWIFLAEM